MRGKTSRIAGFIDPSMLVSFGVMLLLLTSTFVGLKLVEQSAENRSDASSLTACFGSIPSECTNVGGCSWQNNTCSGSPGSSTCPSSCIVSNVFESCQSGWDRVTCEDKGCGYTEQRLSCANLPQSTCGSTNGCTPQNGACAFSGSRISSNCPQGCTYTAGFCWGTSNQPDIPCAGSSEGGCNILGCNWDYPTCRGTTYTGCSGMYTVSSDCSGSFVSGQTCSGTYGTCTGIPHTPTPTKTPAPQPICNEGSLRCSGSRLEFCTGYDWTLSQNCTLGCNSTSNPHRCIAPSPTATRTPAPTNTPRPTNTPALTATRTPTPTTGSNFTLTLTANGVQTLTIQRGTAVTLAWTSSNASNCGASGSWSGPKMTNGSELVGSLTADRTYTLTCYRTGSAPLSRTVRVTVLGVTNTPTNTPRATQTPTARPTSTPVPGSCIAIGSYCGAGTSGNCCNSSCLSSICRVSAPTSTPRPTNTPAALAGGATLPTPIPTISLGYNPLSPTTSSPGITQTQTFGGTVGLGTSAQNSAYAQGSGLYAQEYCNGQFGTCSGDYLIGTAFAGMGVIGGVAAAPAVITVGTTILSSTGALAVTLANVIDDGFNMYQCRQGDQNACANAMATLANPIPGAGFADDVADLNNRLGISSRATTALDNYLYGNLYRAQSQGIDPSQLVDLNAGFNPLNLLKNFIPPKKTVTAVDPFAAISNVRNAYVSETAFFQNPTAGNALAAAQRAGYTPEYVPLGHQFVDAQGNMSTLVRDNSVRIGQNNTLVIGTRTDGSIIDVQDLCHDVGACLLGGKTTSINPFIDPNALNQVMQTSTGTTMTINQMRTAGLLVERNGQLVVPDTYLLDAIMGGKFDPAAIKYLPN